MSEAKLQRKNMAAQCLLNEKAFLEHYTYDPVLRKTLESAGIGIGVGGAVVGGSAMVAATTGFAGFASSLGIGYFAGAAAATAATAALTVALPAAALVGGIYYFKNRKNKKKIERNCSVNDLAKEVGKIIFLPMIAKGNDKIKVNPANKDGIRKFASKQFIEWGYKQEFADEVLNRWLGMNSDATMKCFEGFLSRIDNMRNDELYNDVYLKSEIPPEQLRKFATELANKVL